MEYENSTCVPLQENTEFGNKLSEFSSTVKIHILSSCMHFTKSYQQKIFRISRQSLYTVSVWKSLGLITAFISDGENNKDGTCNCSCEGNEVRIVIMS